MVLGEKMQKFPQKTHFGYIGVVDMKLCSIGLKFGPRVHKEFYSVMQFAKLKKNKK